MVKVPEPECRRGDQATVQVRRMHTRQLHHMSLNHRLGPRRLLSVHRPMPLLHSMIVEVGVDRRPPLTRRLLLRLTSRRQAIHPRAHGILPHRRLSPRHRLATVLNPHLSARRLLGTHRLARLSVLHPRVVRIFASECCLVILNTRYRRFSKQVLL